MAASENGSRRWRSKSEEPKSSNNITQRKTPIRKRDLIKTTLSEDYPGLDYLGFHNVLSAKKLWYQALWFTIVTVCLLIGLFTIYKIIDEYLHNPSATSISVKSVEQLLLPQLTLCPDSPATINLTKLDERLFQDRISNYTQEDVLNFAYFFLAGSGFQKMNWKKFDTSTKARLDSFYNTFRGNNSIDTFFEYFFDQFGLQCHEFLTDCRLGDTPLDCCKIFEPEYLIRRGRCFRTIELYQRNFDELGKLRVSVRQPYEMDSNMSTAAEIIAFIAEHKPQIAPFPRYYLYPHTWTKMRVSAKWISLFPNEDVCSSQVQNISKDACYIEKWLTTNLEAPLNCTFPYMHRLRKTGLHSCPPLMILDNYESTVEATSYQTHSCILACNRWEYSVSVEKTDLTTIFKNISKLNYMYRVDVSYNDLQYEVIKEVSTITLTGLIAQIGGQMSLFMGSSILNLIQVFIMSVILFRRTVRAKHAVGPADEEMPDSRQEVSESPVSTNRTERTNAGSNVPHFPAQQIPRFQYSPRNSDIFSASPDIHRTVQSDRPKYRGMGL
ncbi:amiloride-sensitive sodium channel domain-containing protein [Ditylenchus destructor]|nr:amiloride-sensitive sodium channel domain-containing protein [Ditylenchus destructor]